MTLDQFVSSVCGVEFEDLAIKYDESVALYRKHIKGQKINKKESKGKGRPNL